jgi:hypothetical protein
LRQGEIFQRKGDAERAVFHYTRFINLWKGCDPVLRRFVARAEQALARLHGARQ